jgi:hypothetical protein
MRRYQVVDILPGSACPGLTGTGMRVVKRAMARTARPLVARVAPVASPVLRTLVRPVGIALYFALAILAMALLLRVSGLPASSPVTIAELTWSTSQPQASETRDAELDRHAQQILSALTGETAQAPAGQ